MCFGRELSQSVEEQVSTHDEWDLEIGRCATKRHYRSALDKRMCVGCSPVPVAPHSYDRCRPAHTNETIKSQKKKEVEKFESNSFTKQ